MVRYILRLIRVLYNDDDDEFDKAAFLKALGARIRELRESKGYSGDRLNLEAGFSSATMSRIEAGKVDPQASTLFRIAMILRIDPREIFSLRNQNKGSK